MKLYHDPLSAQSRAIRCFLIDEGIPFDEEVIDLASGDQFAKGYDKVNPNRQVPVLEDDGFFLTESSAILRYLADKYSSLAYPEGLQARARVNEALDWFNTGFLFGFCYFGVYLRIVPDFSALNATTHADLGRLGAAKTQKYMTVLNGQMLGSRACVCGDEISIADYFGAALVNMGTAIGFDFSTYPNVAAWIRRMKQRPGWEPAHAGFNGLVSALRHAPNALAS